ncbi:electron transfer flavoprotein subunit beta/FixA family protein [Thermodesulfovibrionales bacterium]|nr:electron transfer flavoprotein subunit beta/FixA family protein [Thermodesulfovibrionales bacterium]
MKIIVCVRQLFDTEAKIVVNAAGQIDRQGVNLIMNPYDEYAVEEGLKIKENTSGEVTIISVGSEETQSVLRQALAMGADKAIIIDAGVEEPDEFTAATILAKAIADLEYDIVLGGFKDTDNGFPQMVGRLAEALNIPVVNAVTKLEIENGKAVATHEVEGGKEVIEVPLPAVITAQKGLNEPRYPSMRGIMQAKKKPIQKLTVTELGLDQLAVAPKIKNIAFSLPPKRAVGKLIPGEVPEATRELVKLLREEVKII